MQDDLLMDKSKPQQLSPRSEQSTEAAETPKLEESSVSINAPVSAQNKEKAQMESPILPGLSFQPQEPGTSLSPSFSTWSTGTTNTVDDSFFQGIPPVNGTMLFQNFTHVNPVFGGTFSPQIGLAQQTQHHQQAQQQQQQRRSPVSPQAPFAQRSAYSHQPIMTSKPSSAWNNHQNTTWSTAPNPWSGLQARDPRRAVGVPSPLNPISPLKKPFSSNVIAPPKFPRTAPTLTPKSWMDDNAFRTDNSNGMLQFQDRNRPYDAFNLHSLENSLMDIMRSDHEPLKGKHYPPSGPPMTIADIMWRNHFAGRLGLNFPHPGTDNLVALNNSYAFLLFQEESSVQALIDACIEEDGKLYLCVSSPTIKDKPVQIRPWNLSDSDFVMDGSQPLDPRKTIFVGGVPRPLRAVELAMIMDRLYGGVCYAGIDTDPELKYPKGAGRVAFSNQQSYIAAISARFVQLQHGDIDKRVEVKPYVLDDQMCDECQGARCGGKFAPFFCANVTCLQYYCEYCWASIHSRAGREFHKPLVKEGGDRPRHVPFRWS
ncbi:cytoplasmic polyadenylation element-binding protein 3 isoform X4 [Heptranchias perlo]|uniref:cytoplasmic polyadenylation element-binding protein 3 isoform X4 n=1 Tax=Heptranchias perlo TaxID=212740 RepID=UPI00355A7EF8